MSGSLRWFEYLSDNGNVYAALLDEGNTLLVNPPADVGNAAVGSYEKRPQGMKFRHVLLTSLDGRYKRKCVVLNPAQMASINSGVNFNIPVEGVSASPGVVMTATAKIGESQKRLPRSGDTGLNDGTNP